MKIVIFCLGIFWSLSSSAQVDTIKLVNGTRIPAHIVKVGDKQVEYKNPRDTTGPSFNIPLKMVDAFVFKNGCYEPLNQMGYKDCAKDPMYGVITGENFTRRIIGVDFGQLLVLHRMNLSFEYVFRNRKIGLVWFMNYSTLDPEDTATYQRTENKLMGNMYHKKDYAGMDVKFYPWLHKKITHWLSFGVEIGNAGFHYTQYDTTHIPGFTGYYSVTNPQPKFKNATYYGYHFNNGFVWRPKKHMVIQGIVSLGINQLEHDFYLPYMHGKYYLSLKIGAGFLVCYAF